MRYIKHLRQYLAIFPNTSKFLKNVPLHVIFSTLFLVLGNVVKHSLSCLKYYFTLPIFFEGDCAWSLPWTILSSNE